MQIGYARVSTAEQDPQTQIHQLNEKGITKIFSDTGSGVKKNRLGLQEMLKFARKGDTIVVVRIDRIFRSLKNMVELMDELKQKEVHFESLSEPFFNTSSNSANGNFLIQIFAAVAEFERALIRERTKAGLESARKRKIKFGRPNGSKGETLEKFLFAQHLFKNQSTSIQKACQIAGISKSSYYRINSEAVKS